MSVGIVKVWEPIYGYVVISLCALLCGVSSATPYSRVFQPQKTIAIGEVGKKFSKALRWEETLWAQGDIAVLPSDCEMILLWGNYLEASWLHQIGLPHHNDEGKFRIARHSDPFAVDAKAKNVAYLNEPGVVQLHNLRTGKVRGLLEDQFVSAEDAKGRRGGVVKELAFSHLGEFLIIIDQKLHVYRVSDGNCVYESHQNKGVRGAFVFQDRYLVTLDREGQGEIIEVAEWKEIAKFNGPRGGVRIVPSTQTPHFIAYGKVGKAQMHMLVSIEDVVRWRERTVKAIQLFYEQSDVSFSGAIPAFSNSFALFPLYAGTVAVYDLVGSKKFSDSKFSHYFRTKKSLVQWSHVVGSPDGRWVGMSRRDEPGVLYIASNENLDQFWRVTGLEGEVVSLHINSRSTGMLVSTVQPLIGENKVAEVYWVDFARLLSSD